jgi:hypothetical protein
VEDDAPPAEPALIENPPPLPLLVSFFFLFFPISIFGVFPTLLWPRVAVEAAVAVR